MALKPAHDGSIAVVKDGRLLVSLESEKDSFGRYSDLTASTFLDIAERLNETPDVIALGGWRKAVSVEHRSIGAGYNEANAIINHPMRFFGKEIQFFSSSHVRSHIMMAVGMAPKNDCALQAVLVWEGDTGEFFIVDRDFRITKRIPVLSEPGSRYAFLFALADPTFPDYGSPTRLEDSGKLMALAAYHDPSDADADIAQTVDRILNVDTVYPAPKGEYRDTLLYNAGVESDINKMAASLLSQRLFEVFARVAKESLPPGLPLYISGGCGLNCDWNANWRNLGYFSSVFVPPCANDSGSAIGTAIDALSAFTGRSHIDWDVYSGLEFIWDSIPQATKWVRQRLDNHGVAHALAEGRVIAWVQGRWEIGPRALGNRSILAEPFKARTRDRLNGIKQRESYRPIAPCCRIEDVSKVFYEDFDDPYMLYFRRVRSTDIRAVTHVDGSARVQTVSQQSNERLHNLLSAFAHQHGVGLLCNTSLNFSGHGFINRMSDLVKFSERHGIDDMVVGNVWFQRRVNGNAGRP